MENSVCKVVLYVSVLVAVVTISKGYVIKLDDENAIKLQDGAEESKHKTTDHVLKTSVRHFAIHRLCRSFKGRKYFYQVMRSKIDQIKGVFVAELVEDMCAKRNDDLYKWVAELFDVNGDGFISYFERQFYDHDD